MLYYTTNGCAGYAIQQNFVQCIDKQQNVGYYKYNNYLFDALAIAVIKRKEGNYLGKKTKADDFENFRVKT